MLANLTIISFPFPACVTVAEEEFSAIVFSVFKTKLSGTGIVIVVS